MGSFKSSTKRLAEGTAKFTDGLGAGESITYWRVFPHSAQRNVLSEATTGHVDQATGQVVGAFDAGKAAYARLRYGIVEWVIFDDDGNLVPWDVSKASELLDGIDADVLMSLGNLINAGAAKSLGTPVVPERGQAGTLGEASGVS